MSYRVEVDDRAGRALACLPKDAVSRIHRVLRALEEAPRPPGARKLTGRHGYRVRIGDYRVLYEIDDEARRVWVYKIGHRKEVYR